MGTRATYTFKDVRRKTPKKHLPINYYIHWDGYPEGAANLYMKPAWESLREIENVSGIINKPRGGMAEYFLRENTVAEFTTSPDDHGDTEYHYDVITKKDGIYVEAYELKDFYFNDIKSKFFSGRIEEFLKKYEKTY